MSDTASLDLARIYDAYYAKVVGCAAQLLGRDEADDVAQEVFVKIDRSLGTLSDPSRLGAWIYAITLNTIRDFARKRRTRLDYLAVAAAGVDGVANVEIADTSSRTPDERIERLEMIACYVDYVKRLPAAYHEIFVLSEFEGLSDGDIAKRLSVSRGAAKIRLHRARARLIDDLRQHCQCYRNRRGELIGEPRQA